MKPCKVEDETIYDLSDKSYILGKGKCFCPGCGNYSLVFSEDYALYD